MVFLDTSVLLAGVVDFGPQSAPAQQLMHGVAEQTIGPAANGVALLPRVLFGRDPTAAGYRLSPDAASQLLQQEVFARMAVHDLRGATAWLCSRWPCRKVSRADESTTRTSRRSPAPRARRSSSRRTADTSSRRLRHGIRVETAAEFVAAQKRERS